MHVPFFQDLLTTEPVDLWLWGVALAVSVTVVRQLIFTNGGGQVATAHHEYPPLKKQMETEAAKGLCKMIEVAVYDAKSYDREYFARAADSHKITWRFHEFRLSPETAPAANGAHAVCIFVNDRADQPCLKALADLNVRLVALRCAGFNNIDLHAAHDLGLRVVRVPEYSPHAVAEHTVGLCSL